MVAEGHRLERDASAVHGKAVGHPVALVALVDVGRQEQDGAVEVGGVNGIASEQRVILGHKQVGGLGVQHESWMLFREKPMSCLAEVLAAYDDDVVLPLAQRVYGGQGAVVGDDVDFALGPLFGDAMPCAQKRRFKPGKVCGRHGNGEQVVGEIPVFVDNFVPLPQQVGSGAEEPPPKRRQRGLSPTALDELAAQFILQLRQVLAEGGARGIKPLGRCRKVQFLGNDEEFLQIACVHGAFLPNMTARRPVSHSYGML